MMEINDFVECMIVDELQVWLVSKGQYGFLYVFNILIDNVVCYGVFSIIDVLCNGQIVNFDIILEKNGYIVDFSIIYLVGEVDYVVCRLVQIVYQVMWKGIVVVCFGVCLGDIGYVIVCYVCSYGYSVVKEYCGYGIGQEMYEELQILYYGYFNIGRVLEEGMVFIIELMFNQGKLVICQQLDEWLVYICDGKLLVQFEYMVVVICNGVCVLILCFGEVLLCVVDVVQSGCNSNSVVRQNMKIVMVVFSICQVFGLWNIGCNNCVLQFSVQNQVMLVMQVLVVKVQCRLFGQCVDRLFSSIMVFRQMCGLSRVKVRQVSSIWCVLLVCVLVVVSMLLLCYVCSLVCRLYQSRNVVLLKCSICSSSGYCSISVFMLLMLVRINVMFVLVQVSIILFICCCCRFWCSMKVFCVLMVMIRLVFVNRLVVVVVIYIRIGQVVRGCVGCGCCVCLDNLIFFYFVQEN